MNLYFIYLEGENRRRQTRTGKATEQQQLNSGQLQGHGVKGKRQIVRRGRRSDDGDNKTTYRCTLRGASYI